MPPRIRMRASKALKENIDAVDKIKSKGIFKSKPARKALADKTNSASDDNEDVCKPTTKYTKRNAQIIKEETDSRPRRDRRVPTRYVENEVLISISKSQDASQSDLPMVKETVTKIIEAAESDSVTQTPFKTPSKELSTSVVSSRPKRVCRLPSKFEDHSISPSKYIPVQPCYASTPIQQKGLKIGNSKIEESGNTKLLSPKSAIKIQSPQKPQAKKGPVKKSIPDTNNNPKRTRSARLARNANKLYKTSPAKSPVKKVSPIKSLVTKTHVTKTLIKQTSLIKSPIKKPAIPIYKSTAKKHSPSSVDNAIATKLFDKSLSFRILEDKKNKKDGDDIYEFTFDPNDEPPPQKKKKKRVVKKKPAKPKPVIFQSNYTENVGKALDVLKNKVTKQKQNEEVKKPPVTAISKDTAKPKVIITSVQIIKPAQTNINIPKANVGDLSAVPSTSTAKDSIHESNYASIRIEDIAADFEPSDDNPDINYSPVNSPYGPKTPNEPSDHTKHSFSRPVNDKDPLNLQDDVSFFDSQPVANSSMNTSVRNPLASPWRVEFGSLPIKWQPNTYVKANMTPAVECSFIASSDSNKKKHVYTNMVPDTNEGLPQIDDNPAPNYKQTSIISFIKEAAERAIKKKRGRSPLLTKVNSIFEDTNKTNAEFGHNTPKKARKESNKQIEKQSESVSDFSKDDSHGKENSIENHQEEEPMKKKSKSPRKKENKDITLFGFDDSESVDQENVSPIKSKENTRGRTIRTRAVLHELNTHSGPTRGLAVPAKSKLTSSEAVNRMYEDLTAADAPVFPDKQTLPDVQNTLVNISNVVEDDDNKYQSVHLFEDLEVVHHLKPTRKSYGKAKKVTFRQRSTDSDTPGNNSDQATSESEDDLADLSFKLPTVKEKRIKKKKTKKQTQLSKKEEKEVEDWAAGFNSMCEDIDEFPLVVE